MAVKVKFKVKAEGADAERIMKSIHPGFKAVANSIANKEHVSADSAKAILASSTRNANSSAKRKNPRLKRVK